MNHCKTPPGQSPAKLDYHVDTGIFLTFTATDANAHFLHDETAQVQIGTHLQFDEAHTYVPATHVPLAAEALQELGYYDHEQWLDSTI